MENNLVQINRGTGEKIKQLRLQQNWTQVEMAQKIQISDSAYSKIEAGITGIALTRLIQIAAIFKIKPAYLLPDIETDSLTLREEICYLKNKLRQMEEKMIDLQNKLIKMYELPEK